MKITAQDVLGMARKQYPELDFQISDSGNALGVWSEQLGRYQTCYGYTVMGTWVPLKTELLVNGEPVDKYTTKRVPLREFKFPKFGHDWIRA